MICSSVNRAFICPSFCWANSTQIWRSFRGAGHNAWRRVPVLNLTTSELGWEKYGVPIILGDTVASSSRGSRDAFHPINLHENSNGDHDSFLLSVPIFTQILMSIGFGVGSFTGFSELVNKTVMASYNKATKKGFSDISNASD
jgi:hypothetical protein